MVNRDNYLLVKSHLKYLGEVEQLSTSSLDRYWSYLRHLLLWAGETPLGKSLSVRPIFPTYVASLSGRKEPHALAATTQKKIIGAAKRFFLWAKMHGHKDFGQLTMAWIETLRSSRSRPFCPAPRCGRTMSRARRRRPAAPMNVRYAVECLISFITPAPFGR